MRVRPRGAKLPAAMPYFDKHVFVCNNERPEGHPRGDCTKKGGKEVREKLKAELNRRGLSGPGAPEGMRMRVNMAGCLDACEQGCSVVVYPDNVWYGHVTVDDVEEIVVKHLVGGTPVERLVMPRVR